MSALRDTTKPAGQVISETMKAEGGPAKGSTAAQMQSEVAKSQPNNPSATTKSPEAQEISKVAKAEGGAAKGSASAQMQSELTKKRNAEQGLYDNTNTTSSTGGGAGGSTKSPAGQMISEVAKAEGGTTKGSTSAKMQSELTKAQNTNTNQAPSLGTDSISQSRMDKEANLADAQEKVMPKIEMDPEHVTSEDANLLRSREVRAHGVTEKGGPAATAQHLAAENEKKGTI